VISWFLTYLVILCIKARAVRNDTAHQGAFLVPVLLPGVRPPLGFRSMQAADLIGRVGQIAAPQFAQVRGDIVSLIGESSATGFDGGDVAPQAKVGRLALHARRY
jgi:hypothetical protein